MAWNSADMIKLELNERIKSVRGKYDKYIVDVTAERQLTLFCISLLSLKLKPN
jgi:hypothetical protein